MMRLWSDEQSLDRVEPIRKDAPMFDLTPTSCNVNDLWIGETLANAERYHALTRTSAVPEKRSALSLTLKLRRISLVRRLRHTLPRPA